MPKLDCAGGQYEWTGRQQRHVLVGLQLVEIQGPNPRIVQGQVDFLMIEL